MREVQHPIVASDGVEHALVERQVLGARFMKIDVWIPAPRLCKHGGGEVDPSHGGAAGSCTRGESTQAGRHIEKTCATRHSQGVEQRGDRLGCQRFKIVLVRLTDMLPTLVLECSKCILVHS